MQAVETKTEAALANILFATDFSTCSNTALTYATALARRYGSRLHLAHVVPNQLLVMVPPSAYIPPAPHAAGITQDEMLQQAEKDLTELAGSPVLQGVRSETVVGEGDVSEALARMVKERDIDLIVLGTHGLKGMDRLLVGSVAEHVLRTATCPVFTAGPACEAPRDPLEIRKIVLATDLSEGSELVVPQAVSLARKTGALLIMLHVVKSDQPPFSWDRAMAEERDKKRLLEMVPGCGTELGCKPMIAFGDPAQQIVETARTAGADLVLMGARRTAFAGAATHLERSVAHKVLLAAPCPVMTVLH
ncbi:MAG: universal stress protein [Terriglobales bacterium]